MESSLLSYLSAGLLIILSALQKPQSRSYEENA